MPYSRGTEMSLVEQAHDAIKNWIIRYQLKPGGNLRLDTLSEALKMSQTPIREALNHLAREGLVVRKNQKGFLVRTLSLQGIEDIYDLRTALEVLAAQQAAERIKPAILRKIKTILDKTQRLVEHPGEGRPVTEERRFHSLILEASGNQLACEMGQGLLDRLWMIQNLNLLSAKRLTLAHEQHLAIFAALEAKDKDKAGEAMKAHLISSKLFVVDRMKDKTDFFSGMITGLPNELQ